MFSRDSFMHTCLIKIARDMWFVCQPVSAETLHCEGKTCPYAVSSVKERQLLVLQLFLDSICRLIVIVSTSHFLVGIIK